VLVEHAALQIGLGAAEVLARQREDLNSIIGRGVERLRRLERLAEFRLLLEPLLVRSVVALDRGQEGTDIDLHLLGQLGERVGLADEGRVVAQLHHLGPHHLIAVGLRRCIGEMGSSVFD
jgi:hypothetical protein